MRLLSILFILINALHADEYLIKDDVDGKVAEQHNIKEPVLGETKKTLHKDYNLHLILTYMAVGQYDLISEEDGSGDRLYFVLHYAPTQELSFGARIEMQSQFGEYSSGEFAKEIGSLNKLSPGYADLSPFLRELWGDYKFSKLSLRAGIINTNSFVDNSFYNNYTKFFMSHAYSSQSYGNIPLSSLGAGLVYREQNYYINTVLSDATVNLEDAVDDIIDNELSLYSTIEAGYTPGKNIYFLNLWSKEDKEKNHSYGTYLSVNQHLDEKNKLFGKYGLNAHDKIRQHASIGWSHDALFSKDDLLLSAIGTSQDAASSKFQYNLELLYKYKFKHGFELSGDLQIIKNLTVPDEEWAVLPGVRLLAVF